MKGSPENTVHETALFEHVDIVAVKGLSLKPFRFSFSAGEGVQVIVSCGDGICKFAAVGKGVALFHDRSSMTNCGGTAHIFILNFKGVHHVIAFAGGFDSGEKELIQFFHHVSGVTLIPQFDCILRLGT